VESIGFTVSNIDQEIEFFTHVLDFVKVGDETSMDARTVSLKLGDEHLELSSFSSTAGKRFPEDARPNDRSFQHVAIIVRDMDRAYARLRANNVRHASSYPQTLPESIKGAGGIRAFYFRDPEGHYLEILQFPPDKGAAKWHRPGDDLFMGIDHTAIVVDSTDRSLNFYRDKLAMHVVGSSENFGVEQEHLNGVFGAHLRITALRAESGPGVELLEYLTPNDGHPFPPDVRREDALHWEINVGVDVDSATSKQATTGMDHIEKDPDGHTVVFHAVRAQLAGGVK
jgi:catechol 2,3-dioxygenase-like lactoylglutathione lyase family enzyme